MIYIAYTKRGKPIWIYDIPNPNKIICISKISTTNGDYTLPIGEVKDAD